METTFYLSSHILFIDRNTIKLFDRTFEMVQVVTELATIVDQTVLKL